MENIRKKVVKIIPSPSDTTLALCWDKWINDSRWSRHEKFKEYIYFDFHDNGVSVEIDDEAVFVDVRANYRAIFLLADRICASIVIDECMLTSEMFYNVNKEIIDVLFNEAVLKSL